MKTYVGGQKVNAGIYWNSTEWALETVSGRLGGTLPGDGSMTYLRVGALAMLTLAPMMGALYVMFLPCIGFALLAQHAGRKVASLVKSGTEDVAGTIVPKVNPGHAYFTGQKKNKKSTDKIQSNKK